MKPQRRVVDIKMPGGRALRLGERTVVMGILNVTPDSFSDGGLYYRPADAVAHALKMRDEGADIIDIGGQSTRPGSRVIGPDEEWERLEPVLKEVVHRVDLPVSVDTYYASVAEKALEAGAHIINDVSGLKADPDMAGVVADSEAPIVIMHYRMASDYEDLLPDMMKDLEQSLNLARRAGIKDDKIIIDPGIGFGKTAEENLVLLAHLADFRQFGYPVLLGASRKSFLGKIFGMPLEERLEGSLAAVAAGVIGGVDIVRVHDVAATVRFTQVLDGIVAHG